MRTLWLWAGRKGSNLLPWTEGDWSEAVDGCACYVSTYWRKVRRLLLFAYYHTKSEADIGSIFCRHDSKLVGSLSSQYQLAIHGFRGSFFSLIVLNVFCTFEEDIYLLAEKTACTSISPYSVQLLRALFIVYCLAYDWDTRIQNHEHIYTHSPYT